MRNMSFALTTDQIRNRTKTVTRRLGWKYLKAGEQVQAVVKCMGLKKGEALQKLAVITLSVITNEECAKEGFPELNAVQFIAMFCKHMKCDREQEVTRIEFKYGQHKES